MFPPQAYALTACEFESPSGTILGSKPKIGEGRGHFETRTAARPGSAGPRSTIGPICGRLDHPRFSVRTPLRPVSFAVFGVALASLGGGALLAAEGAPRALLYVDNTAGDEITMIDAATNRVVGNIGSGPAPHGLVTSP